MIFFRRLAVVSAAFITLLASTAFAGEVWVSVDQTRAYKPQQKGIAQIYIGNPFVLNATFDPQSAQLFLTGKTPGTTNILLADESGRVIENFLIRVRTAPGFVVLHKGATRLTYSCTDKCDPTATIGDDVTHYSAISQQMNRQVTSASTVIQRN